MDEQSMQIFVQEQIKKLTTFGGARDEDVLHWLQDTECIFDQVQLKPSNKYLAVQSYLKGTAGTCFRLHKSNIPDCQLQLNNNNQLCIVVIIRRWPLILIYHQLLIEVHQIQTQSPSSPYIRTLPLSTPVTNIDQQSDMLTLSEQPSSHQSVNTESINNSIVDNIPNVISSTITNILRSCSSTVAVNNTPPHEAELKQLESDKTNSCSLNDIHVANDEFIYVSELVKLHAQVTSDNTDIKNHTVNVTFSTNRIYILQIDYTPNSTHLRLREEEKEERKTQVN
ncbi:unnamed protein product [Rotaria socialis]|uniref:Uncharacterized protein n=1 Tax=Rotaria socialis TaxID=392032 RepID=A0A821D772_9BILA|nr:unnamed protein product [Rotaria socialis]